MKIEQTNLEGVVSVVYDAFEDFRGYYVETYNKELFKAVSDVEFVQDSVSFSRKNVLRGIHGDSRTWKLVSCLKGEIYLVVVNCDQESSSFGQWQSFIISEHNRRHVLIPPKYGNSFLVLSDEGAIFHYKQSTYYDRRSQFTFKWNDDRFGIVWPIKNPILSERDR